MSATKLTEFDKWEVRWLSRSIAEPTLLGYASAPPHCAEVRLREPNGTLHWMPKKHFLKSYQRHVTDFNGDYEQCHE